MTSAPRSFPWWLVGLFLAIFSFFTDDYIIAGILPDVAAGLDVSEPVAGQLVTVFSLTVAVATPVAGFVFARTDRRRLVLSAIALFVVANALAAVADGYAVLVGLRVLAALAAAAALPAIFAAAADLAPDDRRGRYLGSLSVAVTGAVAVGVPLGAWIAVTWSWNATFAFMAVAGVVALATVGATFPRVEAHPPTPFRDQVRVLASRQISAALVGGAAAVMGGILMITYLAPYLVALLGRDDVRAPVFAVFGVAATVGVFGGGWSVDRFGANRTLVGGMAAFIVLMAGLTLLGFAAPIPLLAFVPLVVVWGALAYWSATAVQVRLHALAGPMTAQALAMNSSLGTLGVAVGAAIGGVVLDMGAVLLLPLVTAVACATGLLLLLYAFRGAGASGDPVLQHASDDHSDRTDSTDSTDSTDRTGDPT
ncbi:MFS transporter [Pseudonocardia endophytica]|uniref:Putative MFS family arabinose efflux permease n=1 Tax=Pseudonocardia endophytica TaxID=401976 RepID=A0A4R1HT97_PSEEN|nr:MFS transporter [Pseudonocardia endophytica]TCK24591.1 putative MFS family arabinose efflux permease [Pseudonocardia endophytica]